MKHMQCDICDESWEESFFCEKCSSKTELIIEETPKLIWYGVGDEYDYEEVEEPVGNVCGNCCVCHGV